MTEMEQTNAREARRPVLSCSLFPKRGDHNAQLLNARQESHQDHRLRTVSSITYLGSGEGSGVGLNYLYCRQIFNLAPDVIPNIEIHKMFDSYNGSLTQSMHHSANTKNQRTSMLKA